MLFHNVLFTTITIFIPTTPGFSFLVTLRIGPVDIWRTRRKRFASSRIGAEIELVWCWMGQGKIELVLLVSRVLAILLCIQVLLSGRCCQRLLKSHEAEKLLLALVHPFHGRRKLLFALRTFFHLACITLRWRLIWFRKQNNLIAHWRWVQVTTLRFTCTLQAAWRF